MVKIKRENKRAGERPTIVKILFHVDSFSAEKRPVCVGKYYVLFQKPNQGHKRKWERPICVGKYYELVQNLTKNASTSRGGLERKIISYSDK